MASPTALVAWNKAIFFALLLLAFDASARELVGTNVASRMTRTLAMETNYDAIDRRLVARQLDVSWRGNYSPPPRPPPPSSS